ncbi:MAG: dipeptidyl-peptidase 3 family protein [Myxococcales bacterium]
MLAAVACKSAPPASEAPLPAAPPVPAAPVAQAPEPIAGPPLPAFDPQPATMLGEVNGIVVVSLAAPQFTSLSRDQRLVAWYAAQAAAAGDAIAAEQGYRHNLAVIRLLRGILSRPQAIPAAMLQRVRGFARVVYLNHGLHDMETGRKQMPPFSAAELRLAALAASASGADLGLGGVALEYAFRALEGPLFDPRVDARRTVHGADLTASAVNLYDGVTLRDLQGFAERSPLNSRLVKQGGVVTERAYRLPAAADALDRALPYSAPPQRAVFEALSSFFRSGDQAQLEAAQRAWAEAFGPVDAFAGFSDTSADPRGRKALFGAVVGMVDPGRTSALDRVRLRNRGQSLFLLAAAGASRPLSGDALTAETKSALFGAAVDAEGSIRDDVVIAALAEPALVRDLQRCAPSLRFAHLALRELSRAPSATSAVLAEALADAEAHVRAGATVELLPDPRCRELWPQFMATQWLVAVAGESDPIEDDRRRAVQLQLWWFADKGALAEQKGGGRKSIAVRDAAKFRAAAQELLALLQNIKSSDDGAGLRELLDQHASKTDPRWREETARLQGLPHRVAVLPPRLDAVLDAEGKPIDVQAVAVQDLDDQILRDWARY